jgi:glycosyltransferase involved in cell wall biosynthesis
MEDRHRNSSWVQVTGYFDSASGYSESTRSMMKSLHINNFPVHVNNRECGQKIKMEDDVYAIFHTFQATKIENRHMTIQILPPTDFVIDKNSYMNIGRTFDESSGITDEWVVQCNKMDEIWVPSSFNKNVFIESGVSPEKIFIIPESIDLDLYDYNIKPFYIADKKEFNFLSIFDWKLKKGWDVLIESYVNEFSAKDDVSLIIRTYSFLNESYDFIKEKMNEIILKKSDKNLMDAPKIILIEKMLSQSEMPALYKACDCFVLPTRGEGWGRPFMESMLMGLPTIGTGWGGHTDFMNEKNSCLLDYELNLVSEAGYLEMPWFKNKKWANPSAKHLMRVMRNVYENRNWSQKIGKIARKHILDNYSCKTIGKIVADKLYALRDWDRKKFYFFVENDTKKEFFKLTRGEDVINKYHTKDFIDMRSFHKICLPEDGVILPDQRFAFNMHLGEYQEKNDCNGFHNILLFSNESCMAHFKYKQHPKVMHRIKYRVDDLWVYEIMEDSLQEYIDEMDLFYFDFRNLDEDNIQKIRNRLISVKRRPVKSILYSKYIEKIKKYPLLWCPWADSNCRHQD